MMSLPWLDKLFAITAFFTECKVHSEKFNKKRNKFWCLDCYDTVFCGSCITTSHKDHRIIQIRRLSYNEAIKTNEIYKHVDILGVQTYHISNFTAVFINKRTFAQPLKNKSGKVGYNSISHCKTCKRNLVDSSYFCSLACKKNGGFFVSAKEMKEMERLLEESLKESPPKQRAKKSHEQNLKRKFDEAAIDEENEEEEDDKEEEEEEDKESAFPVNRPSTSFRKPNSKRKGVPHRAPFF
ncbi:hypothetical protein QL285_034507 [Trifolium repens]|nr:hypothetical protein QL285_034507 [Trifolium repens]